MGKSGIIYPDPRDFDPNADYSNAYDPAGDLSYSFASRSTASKGGQYASSEENYILSSATQSGQYTSYEEDISLSSATQDGQYVQSETISTSSGEGASYGFEGNVTQVQEDYIVRARSNNSSSNNYYSGDSYYDERVSLGGGGDSTSNAIADLKKQLVQSMKKSPFKSQSNDSRKFSSSISSNKNSSKGEEGYRLISLSSDRREATQRDSGSQEGGSSDFDLLTVRQVAMRKERDKKSQAQNDKAASRDLQRKLALKSVSGSKSEKTAKTDEGSEKGGKSIISSLKRGKKKKIRDDDWENDPFEEKKEREGVFMNLMFVFEIFRWFSGSDVIVRIIIGAIAGVVAFGLMFSQIGLLR